MEERDIQWQRWQQKLYGYLIEKCDRKIFWVIGREGDEGKIFFQKNIQEQFGYERVSIIPLVENERNIFHAIKKAILIHSSSILQRLILYLMKTIAFWNK